MTRITFQNWIVELGRDPQNIPLASVPTESPPAKDVEFAVRNALGRLPETDREFIIRFYFMGESYRRLSEATGRPIYRLESLHRRAIRRLRALLKPFVRERFGLRCQAPHGCPLCRSECQTEINRLILTKPPSATWRPIIRKLGREYGISVATPQVLISHATYHVPDAGSRGDAGEEKEHYDRQSH